MAAYFGYALLHTAHGICMLAVTGKLQLATQASAQRLPDVLLDRFVGETSAPRPSASRGRARK